MNRTTKLTATTLAVMLAGAPVGAFAWTGNPSTPPSPSQGYNQTAPTGSQGFNQPASNGSQAMNTPSMAGQSAGTQAPTQGNQQLSQNTVAQVQQKLQQEGLYRNARVDGVMGPKTHEALENFQQAHGISPSGHLNGQTLAALGVNHQQGTSGMNTTGSGNG